MTSDEWRKEIVSSQEPKKFQEPRKVTFNRLSKPLKIIVVLSAVWSTILVLSFTYGFISGLTGL